MNTLTVDSPWLNEFLLIYQPIPFQDSTVLFYNPLYGKSLGSNTTHEITTPDAMPVDIKLPTILHLPLTEVSQCG